MLLVLRVQLKLLCVLSFGGCTSARLTADTGVLYVRVTFTTGAEDLLAQSRFPSERRPMQLHNTSIALSALAAAGVPLHALPTSSGLVNLKPEDIVDGDRERTLALLWAASRTLQLGSLLRVTTLRAEVQRVLARVRQNGSRPLIADATGARRNGRGGVLLQAPLGVYMNDELLATLMDWVQAVCRGYDVSVANFTNCFGDGVVLCLLVSPCATYVENECGSYAVGVFDMLACSAQQW
jgi:hypothetical protein